ncbi:MAG: hypothetical protein WCV56_01935 [Candidatus Omnitrophota bacterium]
MKRCKRCVLPETVPGIFFNQAGICSFCLSYKKEVYFGEEELRKIIDSIKNKNSHYDCIVPLSGGRDSCFVLYMAKVVYGLKVLAVNYDNEFRNDQALTNMHNACKRLNVKLISFCSKINIAKKMVRSGIGAGISKGFCGIVGPLCSACSYGYKSVVYRAAKTNNVPLILWGESQAEQTLHMRKIPKDESLKQNKSGYLGHYFRLMYGWFRLLQQFEFPANSNNTLFTPALKNKDIKEIRLFDYIVWDRNKIKETITKELDWEKPIGFISTWRTDCKLHHFMNYCHFKMFGCSKDCFGYCNMINSGQMDRRDALRQEKKMLATHFDGIEELLRDEIGLSNKEVATILHLKSFNLWEGESICRIRNVSE